MFQLEMTGFSAFVESTSKNPQTADFSTTLKINILSEAQTLQPLIGFNWQW